MPTLELMESPTLFRPNPGAQAGFIDDYTHRYCALAGGWYAGKTWAGARKLANLHLINAFNELGRKTFVKGLVVAQTLSLARQINIPALKEAFGEMGLRYRFVADIKRFCFEFPDLGTPDRTSEILVRTAESPETITGWTVGHAWGDEAARWRSDPDDPSRDPFVQIKGRVRDPSARVRQVNFTYTNEGDETPVYREFEMSPTPQHKMYRSDTSDNPHAAPFVEDMKIQLSPDLQRQYLGGHAMSFAGCKMFPAFDKSEGRNVDSSLSLSDALPLQLAVDFNWNPGMHGVIGQYDEAADLFTAVYVLHEQNMTVPRMVYALADLIRGLGGWRWPGNLQVFGDENSGRTHSAERGETKWQVVGEYLNAAGIPHTFRKHGNNPLVSDRVNAVNASMRDARDCVHYKVHPRCKPLIDDYLNMKWTKEGESDKRDELRSHAEEADGYRVHYLRPIRRVTPVAGRVVIGGSRGPSFGRPGIVR